MNSALACLMRGPGIKPRWAAIPCLHGQYAPREPTVKAELFHSIFSGLRMRLERAQSKGWALSKKAGFVGLFSSSLIYYVHSGTIRVTQHPQISLTTSSSTTHTQQSSYGLARAT